MRFPFVVSFGLSVLSLGVVACGDDDSTRPDGGGKRDASVSDSGVAKDSGARDASGDTDAAVVDSGSGVVLAPVQLQFKPVVGSESFACGRTYDGLGTSGLRATPVDFRFFVQDVKLINRDGVEVDVAIRKRAPVQDDGVALIDFTNGEGACVGDEIVNDELTGNAPIDQYNGIVFSVGVPESLNHQNIVMANPPLQNTSLYWGWLNGYRFLLAELKVPGLAPIVEDAGAEDGGVNPTSSLIHLGSEACGGSNKNGFTCARSNRNRVRLTGFDPRRRAIRVDLAALFAHVDLRAPKQCHGAEPGCESLFQALGVSFETGDPLETQTVFRPE